MVRSIITLTFIACSSVLYAQDTLHLSLPEAVELALQNNENLQSTRLETELNAFQKKELNSAFYPTITGSAGINHYIDLPQSFLPASFLDTQAPNDEVIGLALGLPNTSNVGVEAQWMLYNQSVFTGSRLTNKQAQLSQIEVERQKEEVAYVVSQLYYDISFTQLQANLIQENIRSIKKLLRTVESNYRNGLINKTDVDRVKVNVANQQSQLENLHTRMITQKRMLKLQMGVYDDSPIHLSDTYVQSEFDPLLGAVDASQSEALRSLQMRKDLADLRVKLEWNKYLPTLSFMYQYSYNWVSENLADIYSSDLTYPQQFVGLNLSIPLFNGLKTSAQINQAKIQYSQLELQEAFVSHQVNTEIANSQTRYNQNIAQVATRNQNVELAEEVYRVRLIQYREGTIPLSDVIDSEISLRESQTQYLNAVSESLLGLLSYKKASGQIIQSK